jgi:hypothetical protein
MPVINPKSRPSLAQFQTLEEVQALTPQWLRVPASMRVSALSRNQIFAGIASGEIRSKHLRKPGAKIGVRLINFESLMAYVESLPE